MRWALGQKPLARARSTPVLRDMLHEMGPGALLPPPHHSASAPSIAARNPALSPIAPRASSHDSGTRTDWKLPISTTGARLKPLPSVSVPNLPHISLDIDL